MVLRGRVVQEQVLGAGATWDGGEPCQVISTQGAHPVMQRPALGDRRAVHRSQGVPFWDRQA